MDRRVEKEDAGGVDGGGFSLWYETVLVVICDLLNYYSKIVCEYCKFFFPPGGQELRKFIMY